MSVKLRQEGNQRLITSPPSGAYGSFVLSFDGIAEWDDASEGRHFQGLSPSYVGTNIGTVQKSRKLLKLRILEQAIVLLRRWLWELVDSMLSDGGGCVVIGNQQATSTAMRLRHA